jgi:hypothetical protein
MRSNEKLTKRAAAVRSGGGAAAEKASALGAEPRGCRIPLGTIGACRLSRWWPDIRRRDLAERAYSGQGRDSSPMISRHEQSFHHGGIESISRR